MPGLLELAEEAGRQPGRRFGRFLPVVATFTADRTGLPTADAMTANSDTDYGLAYARSDIQGRYDEACAWRHYDYYWRSNHI